MEVIFITSPKFHILKLRFAETKTTVNERASTKAFIRGSIHSARIEFVAIPHDGSKPPNMHISFCAGRFILAHGTFALFHFNTPRAFLQLISFAKAIPCLSPHLPRRTAFGTSN